MNEKRMIAGTEFTLTERDNQIVIFHKRGSIIWKDGKWIDSNKGKNYLNWQARELLVKEFNLK